jgi:hypothetical protein
MPSTGDLIATAVVFTLGGVAAYFLFRNPLGPPEYLLKDARIESLDAYPQDLTLLAVAVAEGSRRGLPSTIETRFLVENDPSVTPIVSTLAFSTSRGWKPFEIRSLISVPLSKYPVGSDVRLRVDLAQTLPSQIPLASSQTKLVTVLPPTGGPPPLPGVEYRNVAITTFFGVYTVPATQPALISIVARGQYRFGPGRQRMVAGIFNPVIEPEQFLDSELPAVNDWTNFSSLAPIIQWGANRFSPGTVVEITARLVDISDLLVPFLVRFDTIRITIT